MIIRTHHRISDVRRDYELEFVVRADGLVFLTPETWEQLQRRDLSASIDVMFAVIRDAARSYTCGRCRIAGLVFEADDLAVEVTGGMEGEGPDYLRGTLYHLDAEVETSVPVLVEVPRPTRWSALFGGMVADPEGGSVLREFRAAVLAAAQRIAAELVAEFNSFAAGVPAEQASA